MTASSHSGPSCFRCAQPGTSRLRVGSLGERHACARHVGKLGAAPASAWQPVHDQADRLLRALFDKEADRG